MLMRQIRATATVPSTGRRAVSSSRTPIADVSPPPGRASGRGSGQAGSRAVVSSSLKREAWEWAMANRGADGSLPSGKAIADRFGHHERWGRLVKQHSERLGEKHWVPPETRKQAVGTLGPSALLRVLTCQERWA